MEKLAIILLLISLGLLLIYGIDVMIASQSETDAVTGGGQGFLPLNEAVRGSIFGGGAVALSIIGFVLGRKEPNKTIPILLFINGGLIILGLLILLAMANFEIDQKTLRTIGSTMLLGGILIGLGIAKIVIDKKKSNSK
ncbi:MAG TPA: hypothetical protein VFC05_09230 [Nitrososphaeraceae archaeon]|jgi:hypothetical protein|nr:hypothetical protein [Nitrososphaeraceae archaeon]